MTEFDKIIKKYNYSYNYYEGYSYTSKNYPDLYLNKDGFSVWLNQTHHYPKTLEEFDKLIEDYGK